MGAFLEVALASIIITQFKKCIADNLIRVEFIKSYARYADDTLKYINVKVPIIF